MRVPTESTLYRYTPSTPKETPETNFSAWQAREKGDYLENRAEAATDFFRAADNQELDLDPRPNFVTLRNAPAPGLLEENTKTVTGGLNPNGYLYVHGKSESPDSSREGSSLQVADGGSRILMERPAYQNNTYLPTMENLTILSDGETREVYWNYFQA